MIFLAKNDLIIILPILIVVIGAVIFLSHYFSIKQVVLRKLSKIPFKSTGGIKTNELAKVSGKALHVKDPLIAPLSGRKCVFYTIKIEKRVSTGKSSHWKTIVDEDVIQDFFVEQTGERIIVFPTKSPKNYYDYLVTDGKTSSGTCKDPSLAFKN